MHTEFTIEHSPLSSDMLKSRLVEKFQAEDRNALKNSPIFSSGEWDHLVLYATETPGYRLFALATLDDELQIYVEPVKGNIIEICESIWRGAKRALKAKRAALRTSSPKLTLLKLIDDDVSMKDIMKGTTSTLGKELGRSETISPLIVGVVAVIYALIGVLTFASKDRGEFIAGAVSGLAAALVALALAIAATKKGKLSWK